VSLNYILFLVERHSNSSRYFLHICKNMYT